MYKLWRAQKQSMYLEMHSTYRKSSQERKLLVCDVTLSLSYGNGSYGLWNAGLMSTERVIFRN